MSTSKKRAGGRGRERSVVLREPRSDADDEPTTETPKRSTVARITRQARVAAGRPTVMKPKLVKRIIADVMIGLSLEAASHRQYARGSTVRGWLQRGEAAADARARGDVVEPDVVEREKPYLMFALAVRRAEADFERLMIRTLRKAAKGRYEAALAVLERRRRGWAKSTTPPTSTPPASATPPDSSQGLSRKALDTFAERVGLNANDDDSAQGGH